MYRPCEYDDEAKIFHGELLGIEDVVTFQGTTVDEIEKAFKDFVDNYLAFCKERVEEVEDKLDLEAAKRVDKDIKKHGTVKGKDAKKDLLNNSKVKKLIFKPQRSQRTQRGKVQRGHTDLTLAISYKEFFNRIGRRTHQPNIKHKDDKTLRYKTRVTPPKASLCLRAFVSLCFNLMHNQYI